MPTSEPRTFHVPIIPAHTAALPPVGPKVVSLNMDVMGHIFFSHFEIGRFGSGLCEYEAMQILIHIYNFVHDSKLNLKIFLKDQCLYIWLELEAKKKFLFITWKADSCLLVLS